MKLLYHSDLDPADLRGPFDRAAALLGEGNFRAADVKKLQGTSFYRAKLSAADRLLFRFAVCRGETYLVLLEIVRNHAYERSRFLRGAAVDEGKLVPIDPAGPVDPADVLTMPYVNPAVPHVHVLDKILSFDDPQHDALRERPPLILIGSAGSGKTVLTLQKLRQLAGRVLYVTHSPYLVDNARALYYAHHYENDGQDVDFLSLMEFVHTIGVPHGERLSFREFSAWFARHRSLSPTRDAHPVYEEFNGVLTGSAVESPYLSEEDYLALGLRRSIFTGAERPAVYELFRRYLAFLETSRCWDLNMVCYAHHARCEPLYDFVVADEVQDLTAVQLSLVLKALRVPDQFVLCGDSNQIVHPNFFSWAGVKSFFYEQRVKGRGEIIRILNSNYRNAPRVTELANRLLLIKNARFGSIDRESHYLVRSVCEEAGSVELMQDGEGVRREIDGKTGRSARFAVLVMREEDKEEARRSFRTPLVFCVQEAKGLEYESILLLNFVSGNPRVFSELVAGVTADDLQGDFAYGRAKDRGDKSLEAYKFFVNALYVGVTRAVRQLLIVERESSHPLFTLLDLHPAGSAAAVAAQESSVEEWKLEARRLERQGKTEQVEAIRRTILRTEPVPWEVLTPASVDRLAAEALDPVKVAPRARRQLLEYAATYTVTPLLDKLAALGVKGARSPDIVRYETQIKYACDYRQRGYRDLHRKMALHGIDFRNQLNQTPLMIAVQEGLVLLVKELVRDGAGLECRDNWGRTPFQLALRAAYAQPHYAGHVLGEVFAELTPAAMRVRACGRLVKIDSHRMEFFLLHSMFALSESILRAKIREDAPAYETGDFVHALKHFPESVIPLHRRHRQAITAVLARHEVLRADPLNRRLFLRVHRGLYIPNPAMEIEVGDAWVNVCDLMDYGTLAGETENQRLSSFLSYVAGRRKDIETMFGGERPAAAAPAGPAGGEPAAVVSTAAISEAEGEGTSPADVPAAAVERGEPAAVPDAEKPPETAPVASTPPPTLVAVPPAAAVPAPSPAPSPLAAAVPPAAAPVAGEPSGDTKAACALPLSESIDAEDARWASTLSELWPATTEPDDAYTDREKLQGDAATVMRELADCRHRLPVDALYWLLRHPDNAAVLLLPVLGQAVEQPERVMREGDRMHVFAMYVLAAIQEVRAFPLLVSLAALPDDEIWSRDVGHEDLGRMLASVCGGDLGLIRSLCVNREASALGRAAAVHSLAVMVLHRSLDRGVVMRWLRRVMDDRAAGLERVASPLWDQVALDAYLLHPRDLLDSLHVAYREGLMEEYRLPFDELMRQSRRTLRVALREGRNATGGLLTDAVGELARLLCFRTSARRRTGASSGFTPPSRAEPVGEPPEDDVPPAASAPTFSGKSIRAAAPPGRNAPCPCGSGKKYKKCCGQ